MTENNDTALERPINDDDIPSQEEITEKPFYDDDPSAPAIQSPIDNNSPPYCVPNKITPQYPNYHNQPQYNNSNSNQANSEEDNKDYSEQATHYIPPINYNNVIYYEDPQPQVLPPSFNLFQNPKILIFLSICLILVVIVDSAFHFIYEFSPFILLDDVALLTMSIIYLIFICKKKPVFHPAIRMATIIVWFVGFGVRAFFNNQVQIRYKTFFYFIMLTIRSFAILFRIPQTFSLRG